MTALGRPRTGSLVWRKTKGWCARVTIEIDGEPMRRTVELGTRDKAVARRKLARLLESPSEEPLEERARAAETAGDYAEAWLEGRQARTRYAKTERQLWRDYWAEEIGDTPLGEVRPADIRRVLKDCAEGRTLSRRGERLTAETMRRIRGVAFRLFKSAMKDEIVDRNPVEIVSVSDVAAEDEKRERAVLTDEEITTLLACPIVDLELKILVVLSRSVGGMRTGDLNTLDWTAFGDDFATCRVPRRKTRKRRKAQTLDVPPSVRPFLAAWWAHNGRPTTGPVFPVRTGKRAGQRKAYKNTSYARRLRRDLRRALGVEWWDEETERWVAKPEAEYTRRERELFLETEETLPVDFHSCRRAYGTGLARAGAQAPQLQALGGWSDPKVAQGYVSEATIRSAPEAALPPVDAGVLAAALPKPRRGSRKRPMNSVPRVRIELTTRGFSGYSEGENASNSMRLDAAQEIAFAHLAPVSADSAETPCQNSTPIPVGAPTARDLVEAVDAAIITGDLHRARRHLAELRQRLRDEATVAKDAGDG